MNHKKEIFEWSFFLVLSLIAWKLIDTYLIEISIWKYFVIEFLLTALHLLAEYTAKLLNEKEHK
ncbi:MAG: hypothetical protein Q8T03_02820 [Bacteroidota bacterium]|nr:hypothetical protein [Bacteroidota bacterium]